MEGKEGWVYVLTNEAMPGLVKVGYTMKDPAIRAEELYKDSKNGAVTGVPMPFVVVYKALVVNPYQVEQAVHKELESKRVNNSREFFRCEPVEAIQLIKRVSQVKYEDSKNLIFQMKSGAEYIGSLGENDRPDGVGTMTWPSGTKYVGNWKEGRRHGEGILTRKDGYRYEGEWKNGKKHGHGTAIWQDAKYVGNWKEGKEHGLGEYTHLREGLVYEGEFSEAEFTSGTLTYPDGTKYIGQFKDFIPHGLVIRISADGLIQKGRWVDDGVDSHGVRQKGRWMIGDFID